MYRPKRQHGRTADIGHGAWHHWASVALAVMAMVAPALRPRAIRGAEVVADDAAANTGMQAFLVLHCAECHGTSEPEGDVTLSLPADDAGLIAERKLWETALRRLEAGEMPPQDRPRPTPAEAETFTTALRKRYAAADLRMPADPGRVTMRRLNRVEYLNTIRDLVGVDFDPTADFGERLGLLSMHEHAAALGGVLIVDSAPSQGTRIYAITHPANQSGTKP